MSDISITVSDVIEYNFCHRFIYYMYCLDIPQHEEKHYKVLKGRKLHDTKKSINKEYLRKKLNCTKKETSVYLTSQKYHLRGEVDEVLFLGNGSLSPLDYKFAEYREKTFRTHKYQSVLYALLIQENYNVPVLRGFVCYTRSNNLIKEIEFEERDFNKAIEMINEILKIIQRGFYPKKTKYIMRCVDCCYKNICV